MGQSNPVEPNDPLRLLAQIRTGDEDAAAELFERYARRLAGLASRMLNAGMNQRLDAEDVVQSALGSFFVRARAGQFEFADDDDLWKLLAAITINKTRQKIEFHTAQKRAVQREVAGTEKSAEAVEFWECLSREPAPEDPLLLLEELTQLTKGFTEQQQQILELRLAGFKLEEIAAEAGCSERSARRLLAQFKVNLERRQTDLLE